MANTAVRASAEMRRPVNKLATMATTVSQWITIVPRSLRGFAAEVA